MGEYICKCKGLTSKISKQLIQVNKKKITESKNGEKI